MSQPGPILVPLDFSASSDAALELATALAGRFGAEMVLLHVDPAVETAPLGEKALARREEARAELERARQALSDRSVAVRVFLRPGDPAREVLRMADAERPLTIVIGAHGHSRAASPLLGSVADRVVRYATCPVLVVPHPARRTTPALTSSAAS
ncbi:MAG: universal stress protein [Thermodesulfobacteriota bacterium]